MIFVFFFQAEDGIRDFHVTGVQTCALPISSEKYGVPFFSSSSLRFDPNVQQVVGGSIGRVLGADVFTPAKLESQHLEIGRASCRERVYISMDKEAAKTERR